MAGGSAVCVGGELASYPRNENGGCTIQHCLLSLLSLLLCLNLKGHEPRGVCLGFVSPPFSSLPRREADHFCQYRGLGLGAFRVLYH